MGGRVGRSSTSRIGTGAIRESKLVELNDPTDQNTHRDQRGRDSHARAEIDRGRSASTGGSPKRPSVFLLGRACAACTSRPRALQSAKGNSLSRKLRG